MKRHLINVLAVVGTLAVVAWLIAQSYRHTERAEDQAQLQVQGGPGFGGSRVSENQPRGAESQYKQDQARPVSGGETPTGRPDASGR